MNRVVLLRSIPLPGPERDDVFILGVASLTYKTPTSSEAPISCYKDRFCILGVVQGLAMVVSVSFHNPFHFVEGTLSCSISLPGS